MTVQRTVTLRSGGHITLGFDSELFRLDDEAFDLLKSLRKLMDAYEAKDLKAEPSGAGTPTPAAPTTNVAEEPERKS